MNYLFDQTITKRTGKQNRVNAERCFHIANEGWYIFMRKEKVDNTNTSNGIAGPFQSKRIAAEHLKRVAKTTPKMPVNLVKPALSDENEDWRY